MAALEPKDEYKDLSDNIRHYNTHFAALLTLLLVITGGLVRLIYDPALQLSEFERVVLKASAVLISLVFWLNAEIYLYRQRVFERRLVELEASSGARQYSGLAEARATGFWSRVRPGRWSWRLFYVLVAFFWINALVAQKGPL